jgi:hypothetical protein
MTKLEIFRFETKDPPWAKRVDEAFNQLLEFAEELRRPERKKEVNEERRSFNRFLNGEFDDFDIIRLCEYAKTVADRAMTKYCKAPMAKAPWAKAVRQSAQNLVDVMDQFVEWFKFQECHYDREPGCL